MKVPQHHPRRIRLKAANSFVQLGRKGRGRTAAISLKPSIVVTSYDSNLIGNEALKEAFLNNSATKIIPSGKTKAEFKATSRALGFTNHEMRLVASVRNQAAQVPMSRDVSELENKPAYSPEQVYVLLSNSDFPHLSA